MKLLASIQTPTLGGQPVRFQWDPKGRLVAVGGAERLCIVYDRSGAQVDQIVLPEGDEASMKKSSTKHEPRVVAGLAWDANGEKLAIRVLGSPQVTLWSHASRQKQFVEMASSAHALTWMRWSPQQPTLAVGSSKGNLMLYDDRQARAVPVMGKHSKAIVCGAWNPHCGNLVLGSDDKSLSISLPNGDSLSSVPLKDKPSDLKFGHRPTEADQARIGKSAPNAMSMVLGGTSVLIYAIDEQGGVPNDSPLEMVFKSAFGSVLCHDWVGKAGRMVVGFQNGYINVMDAREGYVQNALHTERLHTDYLVRATSCPQMERLASLGKHSLRMMDISADQFREISEDAIDYPQNFFMTDVQWTADGQVLTVAEETGQLHLMLAALPVVNATFGSRVAYLTSLLEMSIADVILGWRVYVQLEAEPSVVAMGESHAAAGLNNQVWFYAVEDGEGSAKQLRRVAMRDYLGAVRAICMNARWAAVLSQGRILLHAVEPTDDPEDQLSATLPEAERGEATCCAITPSFLVYGTDAGLLCYYDVNARAHVNEYRHAGGAVRHVYPNHAGTRCVFVDDQGEVWLYNPVNDQVLPVPQVEGELVRVIWDLSQSHVLVLATKRELHCMLYVPVSIDGPGMVLLGTDALPSGFSPVSCDNGVVGCQGAGGELSRVRLESHRHVQPAEQAATLAFPALRLRCQQLMTLARLQEAWECAVQLRDADIWDELVRRALHHLDVPLAIRVYRAVGEAGMVLALEQVEGIEDRVLLAGQVTLLLTGNADAAEELFLRSTRPAAALEMRKDLKQWEAALELAAQLDAAHGTSAELPDICRENAALLEVRGDYERSLQYYERAMNYVDRDVSRDVQCQAGVARCSIRLGDARRGRQLALDAGSKVLCRECATILEEMGMPQEAAELYQHGGQLEKAASIYIQTKAFSLAKPLMSRINSPKLQLQYARAKEAEGRYEDAAQAYEAAGANEHVVRVCLERLGDARRAFAIVRAARSAESAALAARYCAQKGDHRHSIEFLVLAGRAEEAFALASEHREVDAYAEALGERGSNEEYLTLARWFEGQQQFEKAGRLYERCEQWAQALKLYLRCGGAMLDRAIEVVGRAGNDELTAQLVDHLMGESDGVQKDNDYLFRLHMALGNFEQAARTAVVMARQEQETGNYKAAHAQMLDTVRELQRQGRRTPNELSRQLMLLHSYVLVKTQIKLNRHDAAARLLVRVARNISRFPAHVVPILTSTVIECVRAGFKKLAHEYASTLMRPEYRSQVAPAYKKKIEGIVRRPDRDAQDVPEPVSPCPFCSADVPDMELECSGCKNIIPFCASSGRHMVLSEWAQCPSCKFPMLAGEFAQVLSHADKACPMCGEQNIAVGDVKVVNDPLAGLKSAASEHQ